MELDYQLVEIDLTFGAYQLALADSGARTLELFHISPTFEPAMQSFDSEV